MIKRVAPLAKARYNRILAELSMRSGLKLSKPTYICAKMTMRCNSRCVHCNVWNMDFAERELSCQQWLQTLDHLRSWLGPFHMFFTGGEALLRDDMPIILEYAVSLGISVELLSNGLMVDEACARRIVGSGIDQITISFDGLSPEVHDRFRGEPGYHEKTVAAILLLNRLRRDMSRPLRILLKCVMSSNNLHELEGMARWAQAHDLEILYQPIEQNYGEPSNPLWYRDSHLWVTDLPFLREVLGNLRRLRKEGGGILNSEADFARYHDYFEHPDELMATVQSHYVKNDSTLCPAAVGSFVISSNGDVRMCFGMAPIGNVTTQSPREIWRQRKRCWAHPCGLR